MEKLVVYEKTIKYKDEKGKEKSFKQAKTKIKNKFFNVTLTDDVATKLIKQDLALPLEITLDVVNFDDYFITKKTTKDKEGKPHTNYTFVITDFREAKPYKFEKQTITDLLKEDEPQEKVEDLPF